MNRIVAALLLLTSVGLFAFGISGVMHASDRGRFVAEVGDVFHETIDAKDWAAHWRVTSLELVIVACLLAVVGLGLWQRRAGAFLLLAGAFIGQLVFELVRYFSGYSHYAFEEPDALGVTLYLLAAIAATLGFFRLRRTQRLAVGA